MIYTIAGNCFSEALIFALRLGAQSVTLLSTLRDPTQLRQLQCATTHQYPFFMAHQKERVDLDKKNTARGFCPYFCAVDHPLWDV